MLKDCGVWTKVTKNDLATLKILCAKRSRIGDRVTCTSLLHGLIKRELQEAIAKKEIEDLALSTTHN